MGEPKPMQAWWRAGGLCFGVRPCPQLTTSDAIRVRVVIAGLCRTDVAVATGHLPCAEPCVLGHEIAGIVEAIGPGVRRLRVGQRVACRPLVDGQRLGIDRDGGFADALVVPERAVIAVPIGLDWRRAAFVEPVAACLAVRHAPLAGRIKVVGDGRIAELTRRVLLALGHRVGDAGSEADVVVETGATAASLARAMSLACDGGLVVLKGRPPQPLSFDMAVAVQRELRFHAVGWADFAEAFALLTELPVEDLLGEIHPLAALGDLLSTDEDRKLFLAPSAELVACAA